MNRNNTIEAKKTLELGPPAKSGPPVRRTYHARTEREKNLPASLHNPELAVQQGIADSAKQAKKLLVEAPISGASSVVSHLGRITKKTFDHLNNNSATDPTVAKAKNLGLSVLSGGFMLLAAKNSLAFLKNLISEDKKGSLTLQGVSTFAQWAMGMSLWNTVANIPGKFKIPDLRSVLTGTGLVALLSQLSGFRLGKHNLVSNLAKITGTTEALDEALPRSKHYGITQSMPDVNFSML